MSWTDTQENALGGGRGMGAVQKVSIHVLKGGKTQPGLAKTQMLQFYKMNYCRILQYTGQFLQYSGMLSFKKKKSKITQFLTDCIVATKVTANY